MSKNIDLSPLYKESDHNIKVTRRELMRMIMKAESALDGGGVQVDMATALEDIRETLSEFLEEPERRIR